MNPAPTMRVPLKSLVENFDMKKEPSNHIDFLILGALGQMGKVAQDSLPQTIKELAAHSLYVRSINLVDPGYRDAGKAFHAIIGNDTLLVRKFSTLSDALHLFLRSDAVSGGNIFIYDASPTPYHFGHLALITDLFLENVCYLGEKPIFITQEQLAILQNATLPQIYCNFSETMSVVSLKLTEELAGQNVINTHIARISSVAKKKAYGLDRDGVTGGALFDKGIHALAFTIHILGVEQIASYEISRSHIESLCNDDRGQAGIYLDSMNGWDKKKISPRLNPFDWSVDGAINTSVKWRISDAKSTFREVNSNYYFSWLGIETLSEGFSAFQKRMANLGFEDREWRLDVDLSKKVEVNLIDEHVRCSVIETDKYFYVCNFLSSADPVNDAAIWQVEKSSNERKRIFPATSGDGSVFNKVREGKTNRALVESILDWYGIRAALNLSRPITTLTHEVLLKLRDAAYKELVL